jgi:methionyl-tRNA formyltransferase
VADPHVLLFGDTVGLPRLLRVLDPEVVQAVVRAEIRPKQERELTDLGHSHGLPVLVQPRQGSDAYPVFVERVRAIAPRMIVVDSYSMLLPPDVLAIPPLGAVNVHYAPLPRYRGPNPTQWAIINGERETAVTIHLMTDEVDAGDILAQRLVPIAFEDTWVDVHARLDAAAEDLLGDQLPRILTGRVRRRPQDEELATRSKRRSREDGLIDWDSTVVRIHDLVRALVPPLPGAHYVSSGQEVVIDRYLTVAEVTALKFGGPGDRALSGDSIRLRPDGPPADNRLELAIETVGGKEVGTCELFVDWKIGSTRMVVGSPKEHRSEAESLAVRFVETELEIAAVRVEHD